MSTDQKITEIISYLETEFPGYAIDQSTGPGGDTVLQLSAPSGTHVVRVQEAFLKSISVEDLKTRLGEFRLAGTLRDIGEFPIVLSVNGCIFA